MPITKEVFANCLNGREYLNEIQKSEEQAAKEKGFLVVFGASDDLVEFRGAIYEEFGAYNGTTLFFYAGKVLMNECEEEDCPYFARLQRKAKNKIEAIWNKDGYSWVIESNMPYAPFDIIEDGEKYCRGIVIDLNSANE